MEKYELGLAAAKIYDFVWSYFCDWYIELTKPVLYGDDMQKKNSTLSVLIYVLDKLLKLLHPFIPFITEEIYGNLLAGGGSIMVKEFPTYCSKSDYPQESEHMDIIIDTIKAIRNLRSEMNVQPSKRILVNILPAIEKQIFENGSLYIQKLANASDVVLVSSDDGNKDNTTVVLPHCKIIIASNELIDKEKELIRLDKELKLAQSELMRAQGKLQSQGFMSKAPKELIEAEKQKVEKYKLLTEQLSKSIESLK